MSERPKLLFPKISGDQPEKIKNAVKHPEPKFSTKNQRSPDSNMANLKNSQENTNTLSRKNLRSQDSNILLKNKNNPEKSNHLGRKNQLSSSPKNAKKSQPQIIFKIDCLIISKIDPSTELDMGMAVALNAQSVSPLSEMSKCSIISLHSIQRKKLRGYQQRLEK